MENPNRQTKKQHYDFCMNIEQTEHECAQALLAYAYNLVITYNNHPDDRDAAIVGLMARALELHTNKPINISGMYK
jgi:hypothetical protein